MFCRGLVCQVNLRVNNHVVEMFADETQQVCVVLSFPHALTGSYGDAVVLLVVFCSCLFCEIELSVSFPMVVFCPGRARCRRPALLTEHTLEHTVCGASHVVVSPVVVSPVLRLKSSVSLVSPGLGWYLSSLLSWLSTVSSFVRNTRVVVS